MKWTPPVAIRNEIDDSVKFQGCVKQLNSKACQLEPIPSTFSDVPDITKHMTPHILEEGINSLHQEFLENSRNGEWTRNVYTLYLRSCTPVEQKTLSSESVRLHEFAFHLNSKDIKPPTNLGEMFAIYSPSWKQSSCCLGFIGSNDINSTFLTDQKTEDEDAFDLCKLWISVSNKAVENSGWLPKSEMVSYDFVRNTSFSSCEMSMQSITQCSFSYCNKPPRNADGTFLQQKMFAINVGTCTGKGIFH